MISEVADNNTINDSQIDLASLISARVIRGSEETSAPMEELGFSLSMTEFSSTVVKFKIYFENPLSISIGEESDILVLKMEQPELFVSQETGKTLASDTTERKEIPKQFLNVASYKLAVMAGSSV